MYRIVGGQALSLTCRMNGFALFSSLVNYLCFFTISVMRCWSVTIKVIVVGVSLFLILSFLSQSEKVPEPAVDAFKNVHSKASERCVRKEQLLSILQRFHLLSKK